MIKYNIIQDIISLKKIIEAWHNIICMDKKYEIFQTPEWIISWYIHYCSNDKIFCIIFFNDINEIISIVPLFKKNNSNNLLFAGFPLNDYNNLIIKSEYKSVNILLKVLKILDSNLLFNCIDANSDWLKDSHFKNKHNPSIIKADDIAVRIELPENIYSLKKKISKKRLKKILYYENRLLKHKNIEFSKLTMKYDLDYFFEIFQKNKTSTWLKLGNYDKILPELKEDRFYRFIQQVTAQLLLKKQIIVPCIIIDGEIVASGLYFSFQNKIMKYMQSWDYKFKQFNIGTVMDWMMINNSIQENYDYFDFGRGAESYKYEFGGQNRNLVQAFFKFKSDK